jgi:hypothetical protein
MTAVEVDVAMSRIARLCAGHVQRSVMNGPELERLLCISVTNFLSLSDDIIGHCCTRYSGMQQCLFYICFREYLNSGSRLRRGRAAFQWAFVSLGTNWWSLLGACDLLFHELWLMLLGAGLSRQVGKFNPRCLCRIPSGWSDFGASFSTRVFFSFAIQLLRSSSWGALSDERTDLYFVVSFQAYYGIWGFNTEFTRALHLFLLWSRPIQSITPPLQSFLSKAHLNIIHPPTSWSSLQKKRRRN